MSTPTVNTAPPTNLHQLRIKYLTRVLKPLAWEWVPNFGYPHFEAETTFAKYIVQPVASFADGNQLHPDATRWTAKARVNGATLWLWATERTTPTSEDAQQSCWLHFLETMDKVAR